VCRQETLLQFELLTAGLVRSGIALEQIQVKIQISKLALRLFFKQMVVKPALDGAHLKTLRWVEEVVPVELVQMVEMVV
jgi:hypothetical protein